MYVCTCLNIDWRISIENISMSSKREGEGERERECACVCVSYINFIMFDVKQYDCYR